jgi:hypothetical protein
LQISQGYIIRILQHFATKLWNITNFVMLFQAVMKFLPFAKSKEQRAKSKEQKAKSIKVKSKKQKAKSKKQKAKSKKQKSKKSKKCRSKFSL